METAYNLYGPDEKLVTDMTRVNHWLRNVIFKNNSHAQSMFYSLSRQDIVENEAAKILLSSYSDQLICQIFSGTNITLLELWNTAFPDKRCSTEAEYQFARQSPGIDRASHELYEEVDSSSQMSELSSRMGFLFGRRTPPLRRKSYDGTTSTPANIPLEAKRSSSFSIKK